MAPGKNKFHYRKSFKIIHWGCAFDSLLELKFAISIQEEYEFLRERVTIYYHHGTLKPTDYIKEGVRHYTPDFLMRNKQTGEAILIEIKPRAAENDPQLKLRKEVAENYIKWKGYDWKYKVIFDDEIILSESLLPVFEDCCRLKSKSAFKIWLQELNRRYDRSAPTFLAKVPGNTDILFVMFGERSKKNEPNAGRCNSGTEIKYQDTAKTDTPKTNAGSLAYFFVASYGTCRNKHNGR